MLVTSQHHGFQIFSGHSTSWGPSPRFGAMARSPVRHGRSCCRYCPSALVSASRYRPAGLLVCVPTACATLDVVASCSRSPCWCHPCEAFMQGSSVRSLPLGCAFRPCGERFCRLVRSFVFGTRYVRPNSKADSTYLDWDVQYLGACPASRNQRSEAD